MFYSQFILAKKGPLATIWIAAHLERKLRKAQVSGTSITDSVDSIINSAVPIALRLSGHLLLGVVRIYSKKVGYLLHDCSEALVTVKAAFAAAPAAGAGHVDLPGAGATVPFQAVTLPEADLDFDDFGLLPAAPPPAFLSESFVDPNVSAREAITLEERPLPPDMFHGQWDSDERFGAAMEMPPLELEVASASQELQRQAGPADEPPPPPPSPPPFPEAAGDAGAVHADAAAGSTQLEPMDIDQDREGQPSVAAAEEVVAAAGTAAANGANAVRDEEEYPEPEVLRSMATQEVGGEPPPFSPALGLNLDETPSTRGKRTSGGLEVDPTSARSTSGMAMALELPSPGGSIAGAGGAGAGDILAALPSPGAAELSPSAAAAGKAAQRRRRPRRHHLVVDAVTFLSSEVMKRQLEDTSDIRRVRRRPPPPVAAAEGAAFAHVSRLQGKGLTLDLFAAPSMPGLNAELVDFYQRVVAMPPAHDLPLEALPTQETPREPVEPAQPMAAGGGDTEPLSSFDAVPVGNQSVSTFPPMRPHPQPPPLATGSPAGFYDGEPETVREIPAMELDAATEMVATPVAEPPEREHQAAHADETLELDSEDRPRRDVDTIVNGSGAAEELLPGLDLEADFEASVGRQALAGRDEGERGDVSADEPASARHPPEERPVARLDFLGDNRGIDGLDADDALTEEEPNGAVPSSIKDSGWSSRTRGVASYLQKAFKGLGLEDSNKAPAEAAPRLSLQGIVAGKSRREAARMFFETLVLKSKDYIDVEQAEAYGTVLVSARSKLMSVDF